MVKTSGEPVPVGAVLGTGSFGMVRTADPPVPEYVAVLVGSCETSSPKVGRIGCPVEN